MTVLLDSDSVDRTVLLGLYDGSQTSLEAAREEAENRGIIVCADAQTCSEPSGQAAMLTAIITAVRAFGKVLVAAESSNAIVLRGVYRGRSLSDVISNVGAAVISFDEGAVIEPTWPLLLIGAKTPLPVEQEGIATQGQVVLRASWEGWRAFVVSGAAVTHRSTDTNCILAPIAAAALGVSEALGVARQMPGSDAGYRSITLNLWNSGAGGEQDDTEPNLCHAPSAWWFIGLGHLGQAYSWVISWLNYVDPSEISVVLQDNDRTVPANHSTGVLTPKECKGRPKTRLVAEALENAGFKTQIIERRLGSDLRVTDEEKHHVALLGVDNLDARRRISDVGWNIALDVGLGNSAANFDSILIRRFPGRLPSSQVPGWIDGPSEEIKIPSTQAFDDLSQRFDQCGVVELAGKAVGASFVGIVAATIAVSEATRKLHGGRGAETLRFDLGSLLLRSDPATDETGAISIPLDGP